MNCTTRQGRGLTLCGLLSLLVFVTACQTTATKEAKVAAPLPEMARPAIGVGFKSIAVENGKEITTKLVAETSTTWSFERSDGCSWTTLNTGYSPTTEWSNCGSGGSSGAQEVKLTSGSPFPLKLGSSWSYSMVGESSSGGSWAGDRDCSVKGASKITAPHLGRDFDTYKVVCSDQWTTRTYYMSPELGYTVRYIRDHTSRGTTLWDLKKIVSKGASS